MSDKELLFRIYKRLFSSVQFSCSVMSNSLWPHELQHARPPCPSATPGVHPNPCPLSVMESNHLILCHPLLLLPSVFPSIRVFSNESALRIRWTEVKWSCSVVSDSATPWTVAYQAPLFLGLPRQEYWSGLPFPSPGDLPNPGIKPRSPILQADALPSEPPGKPHVLERLIK